MDPYSLMTSPGTDNRFFGVTIGVVTNNKDPDGLGRVKTSLPWMADQVETDWARVVTPMAGSGRTRWPGKNGGRRTGKLLPQRLPHAHRDCLISDDYTTRSTPWAPLRTLSAAQQILDLGDATISAPQGATTKSALTCPQSLDPYLTDG